MKESVETSLSRLKQLYVDEIAQMVRCVWAKDQKGEQRHEQTAERIQWAIDYVEGQKDG